MTQLTFINHWYLYSELWGKGFGGLVIEELRNLEVIDD